LFVALWPSAPVLQCLADLLPALQAECGGRTIIRQNQHITLVFLGDVSAARVAGVQRAMRSAASHCFALQLDALAYRKRGGLLWARTTQMPDVLDALVRRLRTTLRDLGVSMDDRAFVPHLTLLRDARKPARVQVLAPVRWTVDEMTLVRSHLQPGGSRYEIVYRVPLTPRASSA
jgi:RNA 2',3'-cyclic 3'-phosphodiesterase